MIVATIGVLLAVVVAVSGVRTSSARFAASTENRTNLWEAATIELDVDGEGERKDLMLNGAALHTESELRNCVLVDLRSSTEAPRLRLHGTIGSDDGLAPYFDVTIERGTVDGGCERFITEQTVYSGTLQSLTSNHGSFSSGVQIDEMDRGLVPLRFTGSVQNTNEAQGRSLRYVVHIEAKP